MTSGSGMSFQDVVALNSSARLNQLAGFEVTAAANGTAEIVMQWSDDLTQYAGHLHAGMIAALLDTACGFAAVTKAGNVTASHFSLNCLKPAVGGGLSRRESPSGPAASRFLQKRSSFPRTSRATGRWSPRATL